MAIDKSGQWWKASDPSDIQPYLVAFTAGSYPIAAFRPAVCICGSLAFHVDADDNEGTARRTCTRCSHIHFIGDSAEYWAGAEPERCACPCGEESMNVGVGFALYPDDHEVQWLYIGCRCTRCGVLGCYADWKVAYSPSLHLLAQA